MKKIVILSMGISFAMICSCQKQDAVTEQQLAQRKVELDARDDTLIERETGLSERKIRLDGREKALDEREKALAENGKFRANVRTIPPDAQSQDVIPDAAEAKAERDRRIQQLTAEFRAKMADPSQLNSARAEKERLTQERLAERQRAPEQLQGQKQRKSKMFSGAVFPAPEASSPTPSPAPESTSPTPSPTP
jgi:hypothetical protein